MSDEFNKRTYVFDIDGTICTSLCENKKQNYADAVPNFARIQKINSLYEEGNTIVMLTARGMGRSNNNQVAAYSLFYDFTLKQLEQWGVKYHRLFLGKPAGDVYVDDKGCKDMDFFEDMNYG